ncbi:hypothetical protein ZIOFF_037163 [Zingiber officinale]|uniref:60S ribosomal protein L12 n=1 Tax=Zingiber officinale TaxID=94328 RepID=A0A8J5GFI0_ZINOF|nr:hypothetical protein ZIOFF_037163 [Zingiber officinale]
MPPKLDPSQVVDVFVRVTGGEVGAASSLAPKIGPLGLSPKKIGEDIAKETAKDWKGLRVTVKLTVQNRQAKVTVVPSAAALVIKALKEPERDRKKTKNIKHNGNISLDDVTEIARVMRPRSMAKDLSGTVKEILGTCVSVGCTVDGKDPKDLQQEISDGEAETTRGLRAEDNGMNLILDDLIRQGREKKLKIVPSHIERSFGARRTGAAENAVTPFGDSLQIKENPNPPRRREASSDSPESVCGTSYRGSSAGDGAAREAKRTAAASHAGAVLVIVLAVAIVLALLPPPLLLLILLLPIPFIPFGQGSISGKVFCCLEFVPVKNSILHSERLLLPAAAACGETTRHCDAVLADEEVPPTFVAADHWAI